MLPNKYSLFRRELRGCKPQEIPTAINLHETLKQPERAIQINPSRKNVTSTV